MNWKGQLLWALENDAIELVLRRMSVPVLASIESEYPDEMTDQEAKSCTSAMLP